jgi:hypothetical protein
MLKCLAIIVLLLTTQKPLPVDGSQQQEHPQNHADSTQPVTPPPVISEVDKENADYAQRYAYYKSHPKEYLKTAFAPAYFSNWILAGLGIVAGVIGLCTLGAIRKQAAAQMDADRGWVTANTVGNPLKAINTPGYTPGIVYQIEFSGNSPVKIIKERFRCRIVPSIEGTTPPQPALEKTPTFKFDEGMSPGETVYPSRHKYDISVSLETGPITDQQWLDLKDGKTTLCAYGCIEYEDVFRKLRHTTVCSIYRFNLGGGIEHS